MMSPWLQRVISSSTGLIRSVETCSPMCSGRSSRGYMVARRPSLTCNAKGSWYLQVVQPYNRLRTELAAAKKLESRASEELDAARPGHDLPPSLKAAAEACSNP